MTFVESHLPDNVDLSIVFDAETSDIGQTHVIDIESVQMIRFDLDGSEERVYLERCQINEDAFSRQPFHKLRLLRATRHNERRIRELEIVCRGWNSTSQPIDVTVLGDLNRRITTVPKPSIDMELVNSGGRTNFGLWVEFLGISDMPSEYLPRQVARPRSMGIPYMGDRGLRLDELHRLLAAAGRMVDPNFSGDPLVGDVPTVRIPRRRQERSGDPNSFPLDLTTSKSVKSIMANANRRIESLEAPKPTLRRRFSRRLK